MLNNVFKRQTVYSYNCHDLNIKYYSSLALLLFSEDRIFTNLARTEMCRSFTQKCQIPVLAAGCVSRSML